MLTEKTGVKKISPDPKVDSIDTYFGEKVPDPYRWLENDTARETADLVQRENEVAFAYLNTIPYRDQTKKRLEAIYNYQRLGAPSKEGDYYYFYKNSGLRNHDVLFRKKGDHCICLVQHGLGSADGEEGYVGFRPTYPMSSLFSFPVSGTDEAPFK
jgi:protease II